MMHWSFKQLLIVCLLLPMTIMAKVSTYDWRVENLHAPLGLDTQVPRFSWKIESDKRNVVQKSYQILVASSMEKLQRNDGDLWNSGEVVSNNQLWISYQGARLKSNQRAFWKVRITTNHGKSEWSEPQEFGIGLLTEPQWRGQWIGLDGLQQGEQAGLHTRLAARYLRREFKADAQIRRATAYIAGLGLYECYVNGERLGGKQMLSPVPSDYRKTVYYNTFDVTRLLKEGQNAIGITLASGRFFPMRQEKAYKSPVFGYPKCRINIIVEYADGRQETWATDSKWKLTTDGPIRSSNEYDGEEYDARKELQGWNCVGFDDSSWQNVQRVAFPDGVLRGQMTEGMVEEQRVKPVSGHRTPDGRYIVDFGQNTAGFVAMKVRGAAGDTIRIRYAEKLVSPDTLYTANLRNAFSRSS